jgi:hypothetical protein
MIKLTVMYNLPPGADEAEYLRWRTTDHQKENMSMPGLLKSDFYLVKGAFKADAPQYRFVTEAYFPDMATFEQSFYDPEYQVGLAKSIERIADPLFLISEEVVSETA